jgi:hypothetical protein
MDVCLEGRVDAWNVARTRERMNGYVERCRIAWKDGGTSETMDACVKGCVEASKDEWI